MYRIILNEYIRSQTKLMKENIENVSCKDPKVYSTVQKYFLGFFRITNISFSLYSQYRAHMDRRKAIVSCAPLSWNWAFFSPPPSSCVMPTVNTLSQPIAALPAARAN